MTRTEIFSLYRSTIRHTLADWQERCATLTLNDLSEAHNQAGDFESIVNRARNTLCAIRSLVEAAEVICSPNVESLDSMADELESAIEYLSDAANSAIDEIQSMIDEGMADDEYECEVLDRMEDEILPSLERALTCYRTSVPSLPFSAAA